MRFALLGLGVALVFSTNGCGGIFGPDQSRILIVAEIHAPATISPSSTLTVTLNVNVSGCQSFDRIEMRRHATGADITVWGHDSSIGRKDIMCPQIMRVEPHTITFAPPFASTFSLSVYHGRMPGLTETVEVR